MTIKNFLGKLVYSIPFAEEMLIQYHLYRNRTNITKDSAKGIRVRALKFYIHKLKQIIKKVDYQQGILIKGEEDSVLLDGVLLRNRGTNRYLKLVDEGGNEGRELRNFLDSKGIKVNTMIDLGTNCGEITLFFCLHNPSAKIIAVEASSENFKILESNCRQQFFPTDNIHLVNEAVSNVAGELNLTVGQGAQNSLVVGEKNNVEKVKADTLSSLIKRFGIKEIDFLKIDIEGAEPRLYDSIREMSGNIKSIHIEIGDKVPHQEYFDLLKLLFSSGFKCYDSRLEEVNFFERLEKVLSNEKILNLWFIKVNI